MKNTIKTLGFIALVAVIGLSIGFSIAGCDNGNTGGGGGGLRTVTYSGTASGDKYSLKIIENKDNPNRAVSDFPLEGDNFEFTWTNSNNSTRKSVGKVKSFTNNVFTLLPSNAATETATFTAAVSGNGLSNISGTLTWTGTDTQTTTGPGTLEPSGGPDTPPPSTGGGLTGTIVQGVQVKVYDPNGEDLSLEDMLTMTEKEIQDWYLSQLNNSGYTDSSKLPNYTGTLDFSYFDDDDGTAIPITAAVPGSSVKVTNGKLTVTLGTPKDEYLTDASKSITEEDIPSSITIYPSNAKGFGFGSFYTSDGKNDLDCAKSNSMSIDINNMSSSTISYKTVNLSYVDRDVTVKGTYSYTEDGMKATLTCNCSLKQGWNFVTMELNSSGTSSGTSTSGNSTITVTSSTKIPSGYNWVVNLPYDWE